VSRLNATPVLTDIDPVTFNIDPEDVKKKITKKTKAIMPVHLYGQSAEMEPIMKVARENNIKVIEDAAQAIGTQYKDGKCVGTIGDIGCFSFFPSKNLGGYGDGGLVTTNNDELAYMLRIKRVHGGEQKYYHKVIGGNFRIDALQAAVLRVKLPHLDKWSEKRRANAEYYYELFKKEGLAEEPGKTKFDDENQVLLPEAIYKSEIRNQKSEIRNYHIYNQFIIRTQKRDELKKFLTENEIGNEIYYPVPFHMQECFANLNHKKGDFPESEKASETSLAIPIYPELSNEQQVFVVQKIKEFIQR
jgi:dTDP-4-amino-4,6-dideoxygalactose transaminase